MNAIGPKRVVCIYIYIDVLFCYTQISVFFVFVNGGNKRPMIHCGKPTKDPWAQTAIHCWVLAGIMMGAEGIENKPSHERFEYLLVVSQHIPTDHWFLLVIYLLSTAVQRSSSRPMISGSKSQLFYIPMFVGSHDEP